jgi:collagenase-like PrtC family protease
VPNLIFDLAARMNNANCQKIVDEAHAASFLVPILINQLPPDDDERKAAPDDDEVSNSGKNGMGIICSYFCVPRLINHRRCEKYQLDYGTGSKYW